MFKGKNHKKSAVIIFYRKTATWEILKKILTNIAEKNFKEKQYCPFLLRIFCALIKTKTIYLVLKFTHLECL